MVIHVNITITGQVQRVGFRYHASKIASALKLCGTVQNLPDGSVYAEAEGPDALVEQFVKWCHHGPAYAHVEHVVCRNGLFKGYETFDII
jgi:acylphosphatase